MNTRIRRYIFLDFETLQAVKFKKLEKVCDKLFVFVGSDTPSLPFTLVKEMQKMGNSVKWVEVGSATTNDLNYHICFLMGKLHEKISSDVEFAILSNDAAFDPLVNFINSTGRSCIRVKQSAHEVPPLSTKPVVEAPLFNFGKEIDLTSDELSLSPRGERRSEDIDPLASVSHRNIVEETARETIRRLLRSGNRPHDVSMLKSYILLHNEELLAEGNVDKIIKKLEDTNQIEVHDGEIQYNF